MSKNKELMFQISIPLPKHEAVSFGRTKTTDEPYYLYKVSENPTATHRSKWESWVVCRYPRKGEIVKGNYALWVED